MPSSEGFSFMQFPNLTLALKEYGNALQREMKRHVQVRTGALKRSITVRCSVNGTSYSMVVDLNHYWKYLREPFPWEIAFRTIGLTNNLDQFRTSYPLSSWTSRYRFDFDSWSKKLNEAFEKDIQTHLNSKHL